MGTSGGRRAEGAEGGAEADEAICIGVGNGGGGCAPADVGADASAAPESRAAAGGERGSAGIGMSAQPLGRYLLGQGRPFPGGALHQSRSRSRLRSRSRSLGGVQRRLAPVGRKQDVRALEIVWPHAYRESPPVPPIAGLLSCCRLCAEYSKLHSNGQWWPLRTR